MVALKIKTCTALVEAWNLSTLLALKHPIKPKPLTLLQLCFTNDNLLLHNKSQDYTLCCFIGPTTESFFFPFQKNTEQSTPDNDFVPIHYRLYLTT